MRCTFCSANINKGTGKMFVKNDGTIYYWCSSKCEKNYIMGREKKRLKWTKQEKKIKKE